MYVLHGSYNFGDITPDVYCAFNYFVKPSESAKLCSQTRRPALYFNEYYRYWFKNVATQSQKDFCLYYGILNLTHQMNDKIKQTKYL